MADTSHYKCPSCGAPITYVPGTGRLVCEFCGTEVPVENLIDSAKKEPSFKWTGTDTSETAPDREYVCSSCGATLEAFDSAIVTACPYCGNNISSTEDVKGSYRPNLIIPFRFTKEEAAARIEAHLKKKHLLPKGYVKAAKQGELRAVYVPYWLFDCVLDGPVNLSGEISYTEEVKESDGSTRTENRTEHYRLERYAHLDFKRLPVDASTHFDDKAMDALEPYSWSELTDFSDVYFTGCLAEKFNSTPDDESGRVLGKVIEGMQEYFSSTERHYSNVRVSEDGTRLETGDVKYVMLPIYSLNFTFAGKREQIYMNGQTSRIAADLPVRGIRAAWRFLWSTALVFALIGIVTAYV